MDEITNKPFPFDQAPSVPGNYPINLPMTPQSLDFPVLKATNEIRIVKPRRKKGSWGADEHQAFLRLRGQGLE